MSTSIFIGKVGSLNFSPIESAPLEASNLFDVPPHPISKLWNTSFEATAEIVGDTSPLQTVLDDMLSDARKEVNVMLERKIRRLPRKVKKALSYPTNKSAHWLRRHEQIIRHNRFMFGGCKTEISQEGNHMVMDVTAGYPINVIL